MLTTLFRDSYIGIKALMKCKWMITIQVRSGLVEDMGRNSD